MKAVVPFVHACRMIRPSYGSAPTLFGDGVPEGDRPLAGPGVGHPGPVQALDQDGAEALQRVGTRGRVGIGGGHRALLQGGSGPGWPGPVELLVERGDHGAPAAQPGDLVDGPGDVGRGVGDELVGGSAAWAKSRRLAEAAVCAPGTPESKARLKSYLQDLVDRGQPMPSRPNAGYRHALANTYIAARAGCPPSQINGLLVTEPWQHLLGYVDANPGPCPLETPITGRIDGEPWTAFIDFAETRELMRHLGTACFIVLA